MFSLALSLVFFLHSFLFPLIRVEINFLNDSHFDLCKSVDESAMEQGLSVTDSRFEEAHEH